MGAWHKSTISVSASYSMISISMTIPTMSIESVIASIISVMSIISSIWMSIISVPKMNQISRSKMLHIR